MFERLLQDVSSRALLTGVIYMLVWALASQGLWSVSRGLGRIRKPTTIRVRRWPGWPILGQGLALVWIILFPFIMLLNGVFSAHDVGLHEVDWAAALPWVLTVTVGAMLWLGLLWGAYWQRHKRSAGAQVWSQNRVSLAGIVITAMRHEATAATFRGALMPLLGPYWGVWLAILWKLFTALTNPYKSATLRRAGARERTFLEWALDWVGAVLFVLSGSLWAALVGRAACHALVFGISRFVLKRDVQTT